MNSDDIASVNAGEQKSTPGTSELPDYSDQEDSGTSRGSWFSEKGNRMLVIGSIVFVLIIAAVPGIYRTVKNVRSEKLLAMSGSAFAVEDSQKAVSLLKQAITLSPGNEEVQHAVEIYNARSGDAESLEKLVTRMRAGKSSVEELMGLAEIEAHSGNVEVTRETLSHLPKSISSVQSMRVALINAALLAQKGNPAGAAEMCFAKDATLGNVERDRLRTQGALYLLARNEPADKSRAALTLMEVINAHHAASLTAWRIMAHLALSPSAEAADIVTSAQLDDLVKILPKLSGNLSNDRLMAADLEIKADPKSRTVVVERMKQAYRFAPRIEMLELARWLNSNGLHKDVIDFAGPDRPRDDTDWLLIALDAKSALGMWKEVVQMLGFPSSGGMPVAVKHLYLGRAATMCGNNEEAAEEWRKVVGALYLETPETLAYIAGYEEQIGSFDRAARTYREMANRDQSKLPGLIGLIRSQPGNTPAETMIPMYEELLTVAPDNTDATCDLTYLKLLIMQDLQQTSVTAEKLLALQPNSLPRISVAALGRLRKGDIKGAMELYANKDIDWMKAALPWKAVHSAVLRAAGDTEGADLQSSTLNPNVLRPEERLLISPR